MSLYIKYSIYGGDFTDKDFNELIRKFELISNKSWIKGINNTCNSIGLTFENELDKNPDSMFFPDYNGIEIKCSQRYSRYPIKLFTIAFDGKYLYQTNTLLQNYGYRDYEYHDRNVLYVNFKINEKVLVNNKYYFELKLSKYRKKLILNIYDINNNLLDNNAYISFSMLKERLNVKMSKLALVYASKKEESGYKYFRYYKIIFYMLKDFKTFINLMDKGFIIMRLECRISRGIGAGRQRNKGVIFEISKENIELLYNKIYEYDTDTK